MTRWGSLLFGQTNGWRVYSTQVTCLEGGVCFLDDLCGGDLLLTDNLLGLVGSAPRTDDLLAAWPQAQTHMYPRSCPMAPSVGIQVSDLY